MRRPKKPIEEIPTPTEQELLERINTINEPYKSYACFLYLFGARVSEAIGGQTKEQIGTYEYTHPKTNKTYNQPRYHYLKGIENQDYEPLKRWHFTFTDEWIKVSNIVTLKRKGLRYKNLRESYVYVQGLNELPFIEILRDYIEKKSPQETIWNFGRKSAWRHINKALGIPPHKLRGMRATKDAVTYNLDAIDLKRKYKWATDGMAMHYAAKSNRDIMDKIKRYNAK